MTEVDAIIKEIQLGNMEKFSIIIDMFQKPLYKYIVHQIGDVHESEDILQEVFIKTYRNIKNYKLNNCFSAWLYKIAYNSLISNIRKRKKIKLFTTLCLNFEKKLEETPDNSTEINSVDEKLENALFRLSPKDRNLIYLRIFDERSYDEIGHILGKKPATLRKQFERAKNNLRKFYDIKRRKQDGKFNSRTESKESLQ